MLVKIVRSLIVFALEMLNDEGIFVLLNAKVEVMARVAHIIRIARITQFLKLYTAHWFTSEGFVSMTFKSSGIFQLVKAGCKTRSNFFPRPLSCLRTELVDFWSLQTR